MAVRQVLVVLWQSFCHLHPLFRGHQRQVDEALVGSPALVMSMHVVGTAGAVTVLVLLFGRRMLPLLILIPLVGWSRYVLEHDTPAQVIGGGVVGAAAPLIVFRAMGLPSEPAK